VWWFYERETEYLLDCHSRINNVMALRGDAMKDEQSLSKMGGNSHAIDLSNR
jgi:methylenetetrahydrofolate reductase (NADPH)